MKTMIILMAFLLSVSAMAEAGHEGVCSQLTKVCASYRAESPFSSKQEGRFTLFLQSKDQVEASLVKIDLWMQMGNHGHGSSPLKVTPTAPGEFDITKAYFVMRGAWQIRVTFKQGDQQETLIIPVFIKE